MLAIKNLTVEFGNKPVLKALHLNLAAGQVHGIIGLNGAGKSTFFNTLAEIVKPVAGTILFDGKPLRYQQVAYLETSNYFYANLTGREYLNIFPRTNSHFNLSTFQEQLQIPLDALIENYSTGMKKKLALLALLQQEKPLFVLDEPFNGLDLESNYTLEIIINLLREKGKTVLVSAHILEPLLHTCNQIHLLEKGQFTQTFQKTDFGQIRQRLFAHLNQDLYQKLDQAL